MAATLESAESAEGTGHHHGNQRQREHQRLTIGGKGSAAGQFKHPFGVAVSDDGEIFVADCGNKRIQVFTLQGSFVRQFPTAVPGKGRMFVSDVALDAVGNLWVMQWAKYSKDFEHVVQYSPQGRMLRKIDLKRTYIHRGVAVNTLTNHILITQITRDENNDTYGELLVYRPDGTFVRTLGVEEEMVSPWSIAVTEDGNIYVSDNNKSYIYVYNKDGQFLFKFGGNGSGEGQLKYPRGICADKAGNIVVADASNSRVEMFDKNGGFLKHITTDIETPWIPAMTMQGQLVVTDDVKNTVEIFH
ncbi:tripartite motif-containing protein 3-like [Branchiostoma floridae]|uniref:Tripartite motif-containing protein 3-like n=1 Tax=Branchiostoma floridae TaxID=7739 RepID=A0A9J7HML7_BRAFL|nr:tripartite motif-containing protein 3-like [Branchiostoma floridae]XP_035662379.1 tripartite motif-containing protein 3-like [Branchiostoma floridae]